MSLMKSYLNVLNEDKATTFTSSGIADETKKIVGDLPGAKENSKPKNKATEKVAKEIEAPVKGPHSEQDSESLPHKVEEKTRNPFDLLFNKIISEEEIKDLDMEDNFEASPEGDSFDFNTEIEDQDETDGEEDEFSSEEEEEVSLHTVLNHLKSAVEALEQLAGEEESEESEGEELGEEELEEEEDLDGESEGDDTMDGGPMTEEATEIEELGSCEDLSDKSKQTVKGAVPVSKKKGEATKGVKTTGKFEPLSSSEGESLTSKSKQNVGGVTVGKSLFDQ